jgi:vitamin B12 transporter
VLRPLSHSALALALAAPATAQNAPYELDPIVGSATRTPLEAARTGSSVSLITGADIDRLPTPTVADTLDQSPGVAFGRRGPTGASSEFSLRGFSSEDVVVRVDGIELADPGEIRTQADLGQFLTYDIDRIEVLKGPQSALYGGEAVGGVIDITSRRRRIDGTEVRGFAEAGAYGTVRGGIGYAAGAEAWDFALNAQGIRTDGFSAADEETGNSERDGYDNVTVSAVGSVDLGDRFVLGGALRWFDRTTEIDAIVSGVPVDADDFTAASRLFAGRAYLQFNPEGDRATNEVSVQFLDSTRDFQDNAPVRIDGERVKLDYLGTFDLSPSVDLVYGGDWTREQTTSPEIDADSTIAGAFLQGILQPTERLTFTAAARYDDHSEFGSFPTWRATAAAQVRETTVLRGAVGTGFRAPSNRELFTPGGFFGPVGNPDLEPEETLGWEVGIDQALPGYDAEFSATWFESRTDQLIQFVFGEGYAQVPGESRRQGVELSLAAALSAKVDLNLGKK